MKTSMFARVAPLFALPLLLALVTGINACAPVDEDLDDQGEQETEELEWTQSEVRRGSESGSGKKTTPNKKKSSKGSCSPFVCSPQKSTEAG